MTRRSQGDFNIAGKGVGCQLGNTITAKLPLSLDNDVVCIQYIFILSIVNSVIANKTLFALKLF